VLNPGRLRDIKASCLRAGANCCSGVQTLLSVEYRRQDNRRLFEEQVLHASSGSGSGVWKSEQVTYVELNERSNRLSTCWQRRKRRRWLVKRIERSVEMIVGHTKYKV